MRFFMGSTRSCTVCRETSDITMHTATFLTHHGCQPPNTCATLQYRDWRRPHGHGLRGGMSEGERLRQRDMERARGAGKADQTGKGDGPRTGRRV